MLQDLDFTPRYQIHGIEIDNPTEHWLYIDPPGRYIPPRLLHWSTNTYPSTLRCQIRFVPSPDSGTPSVPIGELVRVKTSDSFIGESPGYSYIPIYELSDVIIDDLGNWIIDDNGNFLLASTTEITIISKALAQLLNP